MCVHLEDYSRELGFDRTLSVEEIINDHREISAILAGNKAEFDKKLAALNADIHQKVDDEVKYRLNSDYIEKSKLNKMTLHEIAEMIAFDEYWMG